MSDLVDDRIDTMDSADVVPTDEPRATGMEHGPFLPVDVAPLTPSTDTGPDRHHVSPATTTRFDGRRRRRQAALVVGVAMLTGLGGLAVGSRVRSPADAASERSAPVASRITVPLERQRLESTLVLSGSVAYDEPSPITLAGPVGIDADETSIVTRAPDVGTDVVEGDAVFEVSGRPIFFLEGDLPTYRRLVLGTQGPDVAQLELALDRIGFDPVAVDDVFDSDTAAAITAMYADAGYVAEGPSPDQAEAVSAAGRAVAEAEADLASASTALADGSKGPTESERLRAEQSVAAATAAVPVAEQSARNDDLTAQAAIVDARTMRDAGAVLRDGAARTRDVAGAPGAIDPDTGEEYTAQQRSEFADAAAMAERDLAAAESELTAAVNTAPTIASSGAAGVQGAKDSLVLAQAEQREALAPVDVSSLQSAIESATTALDQRRVELTDAQTAAGARVSPGEIVFVPTLPSVVTDVSVSAGQTIGTEPIATVATSDTTVSAGVARADAQLLEVGTAVTIDVRDLDLTVPGTVTAIAEPGSSDASTDDGDASGDDGSGGGDAGRFQVTVLPDDAAALLEFVGYGVKIRASVASTDSDVLVVPASALTVGVDGVSRVEVEREPVTDAGQGLTETVPVEVGLAANGLVEIRPIDAGGALVEGDRIVIGVDSRSTDTGTDAADPDTDGSDDTEDVDEAEG